MGKVMSRINRQWYRFNAESRAHKFIDQEKPTLAPKHHSSIKGIEEVLSDPGYDKEKALNKDPILEEYLKKVFVVSHDPVVKEKFRKPSEKGMLPIDRSHHKETELGYIEPVSIPKGKITLSQLMQLLANHRENPEVYNVSKISEQFSISHENAKNIIEYFGLFNIYMKEQTPVLSTKDKVLKYFEPEKNPKSKALEDK